MTRLAHASWALLALLALAAPASAANDDSTVTATAVANLDASTTTTAPVSSRSSLSGSGSAYSGSGSVSGSGSGSGSVHSTTATPSYTLLSGTMNTHSTTLSGNATSGSVSTSVTTTTKAPEPTNTQPCNLYTELCTRSYGNITNVCTHNFPFLRKNNAASNQELTLEQQLNDGVRMLEAQAHKVNDTFYFCHTSCDILNAGTVTSILARVNTWLRANPFEVVTILIGNGDFKPIDEWKQPLEDSGITDLAYSPPNRTMKFNEWPTLAEMILMNKRAVIFMDYKADQSLVPYVIDEFTYMFETPFSQTDRSFPCSIQRPPDQPKNTTEGKLYMANHNLNVDFSQLAANVLIPNRIYINQTNALEGYGSLGLMSNTCMSDWGRYPNFLLVDFYDESSPAPGAVFEVAARANNVTYNRKCCGVKASLGTPASVMSWGLALLEAGLIAAFLF